MSGYAVAVAVPAILRRSGILDGHGAVIAPGPDSPNGVFIAGESGAGKSSLTLAAAVGGAQFVSDDSVALRVDSDEVRAFARRTVMLLSPEVLTRLVPKIAFERADTKALIRAPIAFPSGWRPQMGVRAVAFLQGNQGSASPLTSRIRRLSGAESYARLLMAHPILAVDAGARPAFGAVRALARLPSFSVQVGRELLDPGAATRVIRVLLEQVRG